MVAATFVADGNQRCRLVSVGAAEEFYEFNAHCG
jgi:hypothetical protein